MNRVTIRASSLPELFDCAARWAAKHIDGLRLPSSGAAHLGTALHAGTAAFDAARMAGSPITPDDAAGVLVDTLHHPADDVDWGEDRPGAVEPIALRLHARYCTDVAPTRDYAAVELTCDSLIVPVAEYGISIQMTGTTDRVRRRADGTLAISDLKSGRNAVGADGVAATKGHGLQLGVYELLAEQASGERMAPEAEIIGMQTTNAARVGTGIVRNARDRLVGAPGKPGAIEHAAAILRSGLFPPNSRSLLCSPKFCPAWDRCKAHD